MESTNRATQEPIHTWQRPGYQVSTDRRRLDLDVVHGYLHRSYWSPGIPRDVVAAAMHNSLCFGLYLSQGQDSQIGFARVLTDGVILAYLCDVFVLPRHQGQGLGRWLIDCVVNSPPLAGLRSFYLSTRDAHGLYTPFGFEAMTDPGRIMVARKQMPWYRPELAETYEE